MKIDRNAGRRAVLAFFCFAFGGAGCIPLPIYQRSRADIEGVLTVDGAPAPGISISTCLDRRQDKTCARLEQATTDANGHFFLAGTSSFPGYLPLMGDFYSFFGLEVQFQQDVLRWSGVGEFPPPERIAFNCSIVARALSCKKLSKLDSNR